MQNFLNTPHIWLGCTDIMTLLYKPNSRNYTRHFGTSVHKTLTICQVSSALVSKCLTGTSALVPKCLGSEVSWVLTPFEITVSVLMTVVCGQHSVGYSHDDQSDASLQMTWSVGGCYWSTRSAARVAVAIFLLTFEHGAHIERCIR